MNRYLVNLSKIEFVVTYACTGRCKHCSEGDHSICGERIDPKVAADAVRKIATEYDIKTVMTFGGEPLLYPETVCAIMKTATELNIPRRQVITNGFFAKNEAEMSRVTAKLKECGVNDLLLSVDAFHQETIPLDAVTKFAREAVQCGIPIRLQPAWLVGRDDNNPYNEKTRAILASFSDIPVSVNDGNVIFPEGNAIKYLSEYLSVRAPENPYVEDPRNVKCLSISPSGDVLGGNIYERDIMEIIKNYAP